MPGSPGAPIGASLRRSSLRQQIADALRDEVLTGRLAAGRHFTVKQIAELYGVSATPVREALVDLAAQGLLEVEHHRGFQVRRFTFDDYRSIVEARRLVTEVLFRAMESGGAGEFAPEALASVRRRAQAAASAVRAGALDVLIGCDLRFWREFGSFVGNEHVSGFLYQLRVQSWMFVVPYLRCETQLEGVCWAGYVEFAEALRDADLPRAQHLAQALDAHSPAMMRALTARTPDPLAS
jgi:DNA-binding GntR family transcriptional regulator